MSPTLAPGLIAFTPAQNASFATLISFLSFSDILPTPFVKAESEYQPSQIQPISIDTISPSLITSSLEGIP